MRKKNYKIINPLEYSLYVLRFEFLPGENIVKMTDLEAKTVGSTNNLTVEPVRSRKQSKSKSKKK